MNYYIEEKKYQALMIEPELNSENSSLIGQPIFNTKLLGPYKISRSI